MRTLSLVDSRWNPPWAWGLAVCQVCWSAETRDAATEYRLRQRCSSHYQKLCLVGATFLVKSRTRDRTPISMRTRACWCQGLTLKRCDGWGCGWRVDLCRGREAWERRMETSITPLTEGDCKTSACEQHLLPLVRLYSQAVVYIPLTLTTMINNTDLG